MEQDLGIINYIWLIPLLPFIAAGLTALMKRDMVRQSQMFVIGAMAISCVLSFMMLFKVIEGSHGDEPFRKVLSFDWFISGTTPVQLGFVLDGLSALMLIVVSFVGLLIFIFSVGYMREDENATRFFTFLSLFAGSMLGLVIANSLLLFFIFWELVGLSSYILIGFWYFKPSAAAAAKKAFVVTRIGDVGFFVGLLLLFFATGTSVFYNTVGSGALQTASLGKIQALGAVSGKIFGWELVVPVALLLALLIFCGAVGKSGQFPLHVWLPDAMEGPTPVSALIHAATMVAAGVFLVARMYPVFLLHSGALQTVAIVGSFTALMAALIGCAQFDIKRILAYSTVSQLGFMMTALGAGSYAAGMFHLFTHAFFKALLFLGAGSIIHAMHHEQDIRNMGGLLKKMPVTSATYLIGAAALAGIFPLAGFWSKDEILLVTLHAGHNVWQNIPFLFLAAASVLTAFYMTRQCIYVFFGEPRRDAHAHESPAVMTLPLCVLALGAVVLGPWFGYDWSKSGHTPMHHFLAPGTEAHAFSMNVALFAQGASLFGIIAGVLIYWGRRSRLQREEPLEKLGGIYKALYGKFYFDELYNKTIVAFNAWMARAVDLLDRVVINGLVELVAGIVWLLSQLSQLLDDLGINEGFDKACSEVREGSAANASVVQTGVLQHYLKILAVGVVLLYSILFA